MTWMTNNAPALRDAAAARRSRGLATGKAAAGWNVPRSQPEAGSWGAFKIEARAKLRAHWASVLEDYRDAAFPDRVMPF
jgi:hypothetical protein